MGEPVSTQVAVGSVKGAPGASTLALALGWCWPGTGPVVVAEVDPAGADLAFRLGVAAEPGLAGLAAVARRSLSPEVLGAHTQPLTDRLGLLAGCVNGAEARAALATVGAGLVGAARSAGSVGIWDCGRLGPATAEVRAAVDVVVVVGRAEPAALAHLVAAASELAGGTAQVAVVLVVGGRRRQWAVSAAEASAAVAARLPDGMGVVGTVPIDDLGVRALERGPGRWARRSALGTAAAALATRLDELAAAGPAAGVVLPLAAQAGQR